MTLRDSVVPTCLCPCCGYLLDRAMAADPKRPEATPSPGDMTICISCVSLLVFDDAMKPRLPYDGEIEMTPAVRTAMAAIRSLDRPRINDSRAPN